MDPELQQIVADYKKRFEEAGYTDVMGLEVTYDTNEDGYDYSCRDYSVFVETKEEVLDLIKDDWDDYMSYSQSHRDWCKKNGVCPDHFDDLE